jgi:hypothetical protein
LGRASFSYKALRSRGLLRSVIFPELYPSIGYVGNRCRTGRPTEHLPNLITGHVGCTKPLDQLRRAGQAFDQNSDHGFFDLPGNDPPALCAIGSGLGDQRGGDVVAIPSAFLDRVRWDEPLPPGIDQQARQQAWLGCFSPVPMVARIGSELVPNSGPGLLLDQRRMLTGVELTLVRYLPGVDRV